MSEAFATTQHPKFAITAMTIKGFGRFQEPTRIDFAPVTFLIGPNGAGKSTVARVLSILREAFHATAPAAGMEPNETLIVWFEFASTFVPVGLQLGLKIIRKDRAVVDTVMLGVSKRIGVAFEWYARKEHERLEALHLGQEFSQLAVEHNKSATFYKVSASDFSLGKDRYTIKAVDEDVIIRINSLFEEEQTSINKVSKVVDASVLRASSHLNTGITIATTSRPAFKNSDGILKKAPQVPVIPGNLAIRDFIKGIVNWDEVKVYFENYPASELDKAAIYTFLRTTKNMHVGRDYSNHLERYEQLNDAAQYVLLVDMLKSIVSSFVEEFHSVAPFKLAQRVQDDWLHTPPNQATAHMQEFMKGAEATEVLGLYSHNASAPYVHAFAKMFKSDFGFSSLGVRTIGGMMSRLVATISGQTVPLIRLGSGFKILLSIYCWLLGSVIGYSYRKEQGRLLDHEFFEGNTPAMLEPATLADADKYPVENFSQSGYPITTVAIEELETNLHPNLQSKIFRLLVRAMSGKDSPKADYHVQAEDSDFIEIDGLTAEQREAKQAAEEAARASRQQEHETLQQRAAELPYGQLHSRCLIFETHSEYIVRTALTLVASGEYSPDMFAINYLHSAATQPEGESPAYRINIRSNGTLDREFGPGYFDEAQRLKLRLIELNRVQANQAY